MSPPPPTIRVVIPTRSPEHASRIRAELHRELDDWPGVTIDPVADGNAASGRNLGAEGAQEDWLIFVDDDIHLPMGWGCSLRTVLEEHSDADLIGGAIRSLHPHNIFSMAAEDFVIRNKRYPEGWYLVSAQLAVRTTAFRRLGGFDMSRRTHEDWDLCKRAHAAGLTVIVDERWCCSHENPTTWRALMSRARAYGGGDVPHQASEPAEVAPRDDGPQPAARPGLGRAVTWPLRQYDEIRALGRSRTRSAMSTAMCIPWTLAYLRGQRAASADAKRR